MTKKKRKLKKGVYKFLVLLIIVGLLGYSGIKLYKDYKYKQTYEYKLLQHGYKLEEVKILEKNFDNKRLDWLLSVPKNKTVLNLLKEKYYIANKLDDYLAYEKENANLSLTEIVLKVNTLTNYDFYEHTIESDISKGILLNCNKYYRLPEDYVPEDLVTINTNYAFGTRQATKETVDAYINMWNAAKENGIHLMVNSAYRSYSDQEAVYNSYKAKNGEAYADKYAARPGHSEHQTGLSLDIFSIDNTSTKTFENSAAYAWLKDNAHKYGFILRYSKDKENITGYSFEAWHYRYVGVEAATKVYEDDITYDEYYAYYIEK
ncbi:MAG: M15 family metallopeptidase [Bacilli bacterium]|nr:M15 family metallopeptidase [Bacilli bacterium]